MWLYTLAQSGTDYVGDNAAIITGNGSELGNDKVLKSRAKRKLITQTMALSLIDIAVKKEDTEKQKSLWNTYHCQNKLITIDGRFYGKYCKNRNCTLCCSIRKADIINRYLPTIKQWEAPYFVTLTVKSVKANMLRRVFQK
ncbi:MAG: hypothetical protein JWQ38_1916 [Flavipsychrobacter sp.]|nr:hypothetical protein [Flavipsychrobacter sp.]